MYKRKNVNIEKIIKKLIKATNKFDVKSALVLFAETAVIDDVSVGEKFKNTPGVHKYIEKFFIGYNTTTQLVSVKVISDKKANAQVDFTGDFGHETGALNVTLNEDGLIQKIDAHLD